MTIGSHSTGLKKNKSMLLEEIKTFSIKNKLATASLILFLIFIFIAIMAPFIIPYPDDILKAVHPSEKLLPPSLDHFFGTDEMGRDIFSRVLYGTRISYYIATFVIILSLAIGLVLGLISGYAGGWVDTIIMRVCEIFLGFPALLLSIALVSVLGASINNMILAIAITWWPWFARLIRDQVIQVKERGFVEAAQSMGIKPITIIFKHITPNILPVIIVQASTSFGSVILTAASLSFLGLGAHAPTPEWGLMINTGRNYFLDSWWYVTFPGLFILVTVMITNFIGDGIRDYLNPKEREK